ncbi:hypothetical protein BC830DRAFT_1098481 [Chytriomyces sp. MP71]|nr:hypothetical protein BC830DRAFT_1098481 [Chytriomyces sp. MP71]
MPVRGFKTLVIVRRFLFTLQIVTSLGTQPSKRSASSSTVSNIWSALPDGLMGFALDDIAKQGQRKMGCDPFTTKYLN